MSIDCCHGKEDALKTLAKRQARVLWIVLGINLTMFFVEFVSGFLYNSIALIGDSLDMFGDALAYGSSLYVINKSNVSKAKAAQFKAFLMIILGLVFAGNAVHRVFVDEMPSSVAMTIVGFTALALNLLCLALLTRHKSDDINFKSVWVCSRNDIVANTSVILAAGVVTLTGTKWPDLVVGAAIAVLFLKSAFSIIQESRKITIEDPIL